MHVPATPGSHDGGPGDPGFGDGDVDDLEPAAPDLAAVTGGAFDPLEPARLLQGGVVDPSTIRPPRRGVVKRPGPR